MAASCGARSAATRFAARDLVSIPEPAPNVLVIFAAAVDDVVLEVGVLAVLDVDVLTVGPLAPDDCM